MEWTGDYPDDVWMLVLEDVPDSADVRHVRGV
jgi:hypothetical protein